jgi:hypothetical protein
MRAFVERINGLVVRGEPSCCRLFCFVFDYLLAREETRVGASMMHDLALFKLQLPLALTACPATPAVYLPRCSGGRMTKI